MVSPPEVKAFWTVQELARRTGIPERTIQHHIDKGALPARRIGPRRLYIRVPDALIYIGEPTDASRAVAVAVSG
jgi:excisionase family DNA binding protein